MSALTKAELTDQLMHSLNFSKKDAQGCVEAFFDEIRRGIIQDDEVKLPGLGKFVARQKPDRPGRNPKTGEYVKIKARKVVTFKAGQKLKTSIENADFPELEE